MRKVVCFKWVLLGTLGLLGLILVYSSNPAESPHFPKCPFHALTELHCPGCGTTRAAHQFLHGRLARGLAYNPILAIALPVLGLLLWEHAGRARGWRIPPVSKWISPWVLWVILAYWVGRNVPVYPFTLLAPH